MERLPYIDEHAISVAANRPDTWSALLAMWCQDPRDASEVRVPFFSLEEAVPTERLALKGRHPFAVYRLVFALDDDGPARTRLSARSWADFPGVCGKVYRELVIGTGGHRVAVRRMLKRIAAEARARGAATTHLESLAEREALQEVAQ
jgi:hypothetical protein